MDTKFIATQTLWSVIDRVGQKALSSITTLILAAILAPSDFGLIAIILTIATITNCIIDAGINQSIIKSECTEQELRAGFSINFVLASCMLAVQYFLAPTIATIYNNPQLIDAIRLAALGSIAYSAQPVCFAILAKKMQFRKILNISFPATLLGALSAVYFSSHNYGSNSLIYQYLISTSVTSALAVHATKLKPWPLTSRKKILDLISSSKGLFLSNFIEAIYQNIYILIISRIATAHLTGCYFLANNIKNIILTQLVSAIQNVHFSANVAHAKDKSKFKSSTKEALIFTNFWGAPAIISTIYLADLYFNIFFNADWGPAALYLQIILFGSLFFPAHIANINMLRIKGSNSQLLQTEVLKKSLAIILLALTYNLGIIAILCGYAIASLLALFINAMHSEEIIEYSIKEQISDIYKSIIISFVCVIFIHLIRTALNFSAIPTLLFCIPLYLVAYCLVSLLFNASQWHQFLETMRSTVRK